MIAFICSTTVAFALNLVPNGPIGPREQFRQPPTPEALQQEITSRLLTNYRELLATTVKGRERLEKQRDETTDPQVREWRSALIARAKETEADYQRRIERLERGILNPTTPVMPLVPSERTPPKPPIRD